MREFLVLVAIGAGTYALRAAFLVSGRTDPPRAIARLLPFVGPAVLAALTVPALAAPSGTVSLTETPPTLVAAVVTWVLWRRRGSLPLALFGGLVSGWAVTVVTTIVVVT